MANTGTKKINRSFGGNAAILFFLCLLGIIMVLPLIYTFMQALKPMEEIFIFPPRFFVVRPTLENFTLLFSLTSSLWVPFWRYVFNSVFVSVMSTIVQVVFASMAAYPLAKHRFFGKIFLFKMVVISLLFAYEVTFIPQYIIVSSLGLINTYWSVILPSAAMPLGLYLMRQNMLGFPDEIIESAKIDGSKESGVFWRIIMPAMKPVWLTLVVFAFTAAWSRGDTAFIFNEALKGMPTVLQQLAAGGIARAGVGAAAALLLIIPPIITFIVTQSNIIQTMSNSGLKG